MPNEIGPPNDVLDEEAVGREDDQLGLMLWDRDLEQHPDLPASPKPLDRGFLVEE